MESKSIKETLFSQLKAIDKEDELKLFKEKLLKDVEAVVQEIDEKLYEIDLERFKHIKDRCHECKYPDTMYEYKGKPYHADCLIELLEREGEIEVQREEPEIIEQPEIYWFENKYLGESEEGWRWQIIDKITDELGIKYIGFKAKE